jgi:hypothetical protein
MIRAHGLLDDDDKFEWTKGSPSASPIPYDVLQYFDTVLYEYLFNVFDTETNKELVEKAMSTIVDMVVDLGPGVFATQMNKITDYTVLFL